MPETQKKPRPPFLQKENILKALICLGIIAIIVSAYIQYAIPYLHERQLEKFDQQRITDLNTLNSEIEGVLKVNPKAVLGVPNTVYISVPSTQADCGDLDLPSLAPNWSYHCVATSTLQKADGTGWLPVNFISSSSATTTITAIPVDPTNDPSTLDYYTFVSSTTAATSTQYVLTTGFDTKKYILQKAETDGGTDLIRYEVGNLLPLWANARGLVGYWTFEDKGVLALDHSGNGDNLTLPKSDLYTDIGCVYQTCAYNHYGYPLTINFPEIFPISRASSTSYGFWFEIPNAPTTNIQLFNPSTNRLDVNIEADTGAIFVWFTNPLTQELVYKSANSQFTDGNWHELYLTKDPESINIFIDGKQVEELSTAATTQMDLSQGIISLAPGEKIYGLTLYNRALSEQEIQESF